MKKLVSMTLACIMAFSCLGISAYAAGEEFTMTPEEAAQEDGIVWNVEGFDDPSVELTGTPEETVTDLSIEPRANGELAPQSGYTYGSISMSSGQKLTVNATYRPSNAALRIGYVDPDGIRTWAIVTGGSGQHTFTVNKTGTYKIYVFNQSDYNVNYNVSYIANA